MSQSNLPNTQTSPALSDAELVDRARRGEQQAFRTIMQRHNQRLYRLARAVLKDESEAEDVVQESYLRAFTALSGFRHEASLATWLTRITINEALGRKRKQRPTVGLEHIDAIQPESSQIIPFPNMNTEIDPERSAAQREIRKLLEQSIDALPEHFRVVFVMRDVEDMSIEETALALQIRPETVKTRLHRARRLLRHSLDGHLAATIREAFPFAGARCARITEAVLKRMALVHSESE
jgi:RNA polymerase sigma-70 factor, ECF subfamily